MLPNDILAAGLQDAGKLSDEERQILIASQQSLIKGYRIAMIISAILFWTIIGLIVALALRLTIKKEQAKLDKLQQESIPISKTSGILSRKNGGRGMYIVSVGDYTLPLAIVSRQFRQSGMNSCEGNIITAEVLPTLSLNRCFYDTASHGYNFITKSPI